VSYEHLRRLEEIVRAVARGRGFDGSPFAERPLPLGTREQEMDAVWLSLAIRPRPQTVEARRLAREWTRNIVLSSSTQPAKAKVARPAPAKKKVRAW